MATKIWDGDTDTGYATAGNWQGGVAPAAADDAYFPAGNSNPVAGSDQSGTALTSLSIQAGYSAAMGSIEQGKPTNLQLAATTVNFAGTGQSFILVGTCTTMNILGAGPASGTGLQGLNLSAGSGAAKIGTLNIDLEAGQSVGVADLAGETAEITTINIAGEGDVVLGAGLTVATINVAGRANVTVKCAYTTLTATGNAVVRHLDGAATTINLRGSATYVWNTTGTIGTLNQEGEATVDASEGLQARTATTWNRRSARAPVVGLSSLLTVTTFNNYGGLGDMDLGEHFVLAWSVLA